MARQPPLLVIGNKNYSSWSLRPWLLLRKAGIAFDELRIALDQADTAERIARYSDAGRVPVLVHGTLTVWDSLAICEYVAERWPGVPAWPRGVAARATARSAACEMHAGFAHLRQELPMNCRARHRHLVPSPAASAEIARVQQLWGCCREGYGGAGPWLFGEFSIADAMYAPVALRFLTYEVALQPAAAAYVATVCADAATAEWIAAARAEPEVIAAEERGEPARCR